MRAGAFLQKHRAQIITVGGFLVFGAVLSVLLINSTRTEPVHADSRKLITVYDRGEKVSFLSNATTLKTALEDAKISIDQADTVEPSLQEELVAPEYKVNIYRARPVLVADGDVRIKVVTPFQTPQRIADDAGIELFSEDRTTLRRSAEYVGDGAGLQLTIDRATPFMLDLYGRTTLVRTQGDTIAEMLAEKKIELGEQDRVSATLDTQIAKDMHIRVWREGKQVLTRDEPIAFATERIFDADRPVGYREVRTLGIEGVRSVTYEVDIQEGIEKSRTQINQIVTKEPSAQIEVIGIKTGPNALTKSKGAQIFVDSNGVSHRETYYDLPMNVVMRACGQGGYYTVRADGAKVDRDGYVIVAANYGNYLRCSVVETSMGPGKVYDTGGFALRHPHGFDLATDWTKADGI